MQHNALDNASRERHPRRAKNNEVNYAVLNTGQEVPDFDSSPERKQRKRQKRDKGQKIAEWCCICNMQKKYLQTCNTCENKYIHITIHRI